MQLCDTVLSLEYCMAHTRCSMELDNTASPSEHGSKTAKCVHLEDIVHLEDSLYGVPV